MRRHDRVGIIAFIFPDQRSIVVVPRVKARHEIGKPGKEALAQHPRRAEQIPPDARRDAPAGQDRKSTRLNSSHSCASRMPSSARKKKLIYLPHTKQLLQLTPVWLRRLTNHN